ncbi:MAG TPA: HAD-IC family P-type ATPase [Thermoanaerobaculia bacterium]
MRRLDAIAPTAAPPAVSPAAAPPPRWHALAADEALARLGSGPQGLSSAEAAARLRRHGPNALLVTRPEPWWRILAAQFRGLVVALLAAAAALAAVVGDWLEAWAILAVLALNAALGFWMEWRARQEMAALSKLQVQSAVAWRDGAPRELDARELVPGDVVEVESGTAIPADARLLEAVELTTVEAPLTGESAPVAKSAAALGAPAGDGDVPLAERASMLYKGTLAADGEGRAVVVATGRATEVGRIGELVAETADGETPLERRLDRLGRRLVFVTLGVTAVVVAIGLASDRDPLLMIETGLALAIAAVPEGLVVVATITLALGMRRMARRRALVRRLPAVETLGAATVVCADKTGTLTAGEMALVELVVAGRRVEVSPAGALVADGRPVGTGEVPWLADALTVGALANRARLEETDEGEPRAVGDPTEAALLVAASRAGLGREALLDGLAAVGEVPFTSERRLMATFHRGADGRVVASVKGAPGRLLELSSRRAAAAGEIPLDATAREALLAENRDLAARGLRVLALARRRLDPGEEPGEAALHDLTFVGMAAIADPPAEHVAETIAALRRAGVRTVMITGDQAVTAAAVARAIGLLDDTGEVIGGGELAALDEATLADRAGRIAVYSRTSPADKLRIVDAFHRRGEIVAMLGDGVNDAPALKRADIGVAMGGRGTDVAKETADVVLQDDRFDTIAAAVEEGRVIFDNIRKFIYYLFSCNAAEVLVLFVAGVAVLPLPLGPLQLLWLNLLTDVFPAMALAVEPAEPDVMARPPRDPASGLLSARLVRRLGLAALLITAGTLGVFLWGLAGGGDPRRAATLAFATLAFAQLAHVIDARSPAPLLASRRLFANRWAWAAIGGVAALQVAAVHLPPLQAVLDTVALSPADWGAVAAGALAPLLAAQAIKGLRRRLARRRAGGPVTQSGTVGSASAT